MTPGLARVARVLARGHANANGRRIQGAPSLGQFLQRSKVLAFYRVTLRVTSRIAHAPTKAETRKLVRDEFERHRHVQDLSHIRYLLSTGKTQWESMERYIAGM